MHPTLKGDGKVVDEKGKQLGFITKDSKVCDVTGKVIGIIAEQEMSQRLTEKVYISVIQKDGSFMNKKVHVVTTGAMEQ